MHYTQLYDWSLQIVCAILQISGWPDNGKQAAQLICNWIEFAIGKNLKMLLKTSLFLRGRHCFVLCLRIVFSAKQCKLNFFSLKSVSLHSACIQLRVLYGETLTDYTPNSFCDPWKQSFCIYSVCNNIIFLPAYFKRSFCTAFLQKLDFLSSIYSKGRAVRKRKKIMKNLATLSLSVNNYTGLQNMVLNMFYKIRYSASWVDVL